MAKQRTSNDEKAHLVEEIAALLHRATDVDVQTRAKLPPLRDPAARPREIDVLLSTQAAGYPVRFAIECKNEKKPIGIERIESFLSKLKDVGIPVQMGIFVSASGYTKDAIRRAKKSGLRLLVLSGLTSDRLRAAVDDALHSLVFLVPEIYSFSRFDDVDPEGKREYHVPEQLVRITIDEQRANSNGRAVVLDRLWQLWLQGRIPDTVGDRHCFLDLPGEFPFSKHDVIRHGILIVTLHVIAVVLSFPGKAQQLALHDAETKLLQRFHVETAFGPDLPLVAARVFTTEEALQRHLESGPSVKLVARVRVPRLVQQPFYWPVSRQAVERYRKLKAEGKDISFDTVEGPELGRAWEHLEETPENEDAEQASTRGEEPKPES